MRGHVRKRGNVWYFIVDAGPHPETGKRQQRWVSGGRTRKACEQALAKYLHETEAGTYAAPIKITVADHLKQWFRDYAVPNVRPRTAEGYRGIIKDHLIPKLGRLQLEKLTPRHLQRYYASALKEGRLKGPGGLSAQTIRHHHSVIYSALKQAVRWGLLTRNVAQLVSPPRITRRQPSSMDVGDVLRLLEAARTTRYYPFVHLAIYTGLRRSELLGLQWRDIDLDAGRLSVVRSLVWRRNGTGYDLNDPKTERSRRMVPLALETVLVLRVHREHQQEAARKPNGRRPTKEGFVFTNRYGVPLHGDVVSHAVPRIAREAGLGHVRLHDTRHTHATILLAQSVHPKVAQERLGHATIGTTMDLYSHVIPGLQEEAAVRFAETLKEKREEAS